MQISLVGWIVIPLALLMASEWWGREDCPEWSDWLEEDEDYEPSPFLHATWRLWLKFRPMYEWLEWKLMAPYRAIRWRWFPPQPEDFEDVVGPDGLTPEETLLRHIEWDMNPEYCETKARWEEYLNLRDTAGDTQDRSPAAPN